MSLPTVTIAGTVNSPDGTPFDSKTIWFTTTAEMVDADGNILVPITQLQARVIAGQIYDTDGTSPLEINASDTGVTTVPYEIEETWSNGRKFTVNLTTSMVVDGAIPYASLGPVSPPPSPTSPYVQLSQVGADDGVASLDDTGNVPLDQLGNAPGGGGGTETVAGVAPVDGDVPEGALATALGLGSKANASDLTAETARAEAAEATLTTAVAGKAATSALTAETARAETAEAVNATAIAAETSRAEAAEAANATAISNETARAEGVEAVKADLVGGKVPTGQLPAIPSFTTHTVSSQVAMLALSAAVGDVAIRTDTANARYLLTALPASTLGDWLLIDSDPTAGVDMVNGQSGTVVLGPSDVGADAAGAAATAQSNAEAYTDTETARAETAEALLAPKASPALTGAPTAPTQAAADNSTKVGTTAYADRAVATETTRAEAAEALLLALPPTYTTAGRPTATGSKQVIWVSDRNGGQLQQDTAAATWTDLAPGMAQAATPALVASATLTSNFLTTSTTDVDVTGLSITWTAVAGATYEILWRGDLGGTATGVSPDASLTTGANTAIDGFTYLTKSANDNTPVTLIQLVSPAAGSVTYKIRLHNSVGTSSAFIIGAAAGPSLLRALRVA